jgi:hypothetical protein
VLVAIPAMVMRVVTPAVVFVDVEARQLQRTNGVPPPVAVAPLRSITRNW